MEKKLDQFCDSNNPTYLWTGSGENKGNNGLKIWFPSGEIFLVRINKSRINKSRIN